MTAQTSSSVQTRFAFHLPKNFFRKYLWVFALALLVWFARGPLESFLVIIEDRQGLIAQVERYGIFAPLVLFILLVLQVFVGFIPGHALMFASGYLYGPLWGSLLTVSATTLSAQCAFLIARHAGRPTIYRLASRELIEKWEKLSGRRETLFYFFSFLLPTFPSDLMTYVAGLGKISPRHFLLANMAARVPVGVFLTLLGVYTFRLPLELWIITGTCMLLIVIGLVIYARGAKR